MTDAGEGASLDRARARLVAGDVAGAERECEAVLRLQGAQVASVASASHLVLSACAARRNDASAQRRYLDAALAADPTNAIAHYMKAELLERDGDRPGVIACLERAVALQPNFAAAHRWLGVLRSEQGDARSALAAFTRAVALDPRNASGYNNLGAALRSLGRHDGARRAFERAIELDPNYGPATANLAVHLHDAGDDPGAERLARSALARGGGGLPMRTLIGLLAGLSRKRGALEEAERLYGRAIAMAPSASAEEWFRLGRVRTDRDDCAGAREAYRRSYASDRRYLRAAIAERLTLPMVYADALEVQRARDAYVEGLDDLLARAESLAAGVPCEQLLDGLKWTNFFLAYQGRDDRDLQRMYGTFVARAIELGAPQWSSAAAQVAPDAQPGSGAGDPDRTRRPRGAADRLKVGFASAFFHDGTVGRYFRSWITDLPRDRFEVHVYHLHPTIDDVTRDVGERADHFRPFGASRSRPSIVAPAIRNDRLDVLVYPELGMDHTTFVLAALRLAPRQLAGWGHPVTTGHPTIDGFVTCAQMEPEGASAHYTEPLLTLPGIGTRYRSVTLPDAGARARFGLPEGLPLLLCPQALFKVHPENDQLFAEVVAANPGAVLVMFEGRYPRVAETFRKRMTQALDAHGIDPVRLRMLPPVGHEDYLRVNLLCDAMLDTLHWSGGNTSLDAIACGLPIVTLPGAFMRGRQSAAMLRIVGVPELIAADRSAYVALASRLVRDPRWRSEVSARIRDGRWQLFDIKAPIEAFERLLLDG